MLLSPTNFGTLSDTDYYGRNIQDGFAVEAVMTLPPDSGIDFQFKPSWPWEWNGDDAVVPAADQETPSGQDPVYRLRVRGTEDLEFVYEVIQPDGTADSLTAGLRRAIGLVRLGGDDRNDRDLRLVQGSALDRVLSDKGLRSRMAAALATTEVKEPLGRPQGGGADVASTVLSSPRSYHTDWTFRSSAATVRRSPQWSD